MKAKRVQLIPEWKRVLRKAWSIRLILIAGLFSGLEAVLPYLADYIPRGVMGGLSFLVLNAAFVARLVAQKDADNDKRSEK